MAMAGMDQELGVAGLPGLGGQQHEAQAGPGTELEQRARAAVWIKDYLCSYAPSGKQHNSQLSLFPLSLLLHFVSIGAKKKKRGKTHESSKNK